MTAGTRITRSIEGETSEVWRQGRLSELPGTRIAGIPLQAADSFSYRDPVDGSESHHQGLRIVTGDGGRIVFRLSGTGTRGATLRGYLERYEPEAAKPATPAATALAGLSQAAREIARLAELGLSQPDSVT